MKIDKDFITRANQFCKIKSAEIIKDRREKWRNWMKNNPERMKAHLRKYYKTELGRYSCSLRSSKGRKKYNCEKSDISIEEKKLIGRFYLDTPDGYVVDHIIPLSRGGKHSIDNLQYLTNKQNVIKSNKIDGKEDIRFRLTNIKKTHSDINNYLKNNMKCFDEEK